MADLKILGICGALRAGSTNRLLMQDAVRRLGSVEFTEANIRFPLYDGDLEESSGVPPEVQMLADQIADADAVIIACPEYNKGVPGVLKNALDWVSRTKGSPWLDKPVAIMSATAGRSGGERVQSMLQLCLMPFRPQLLIGPEVLVAASFKEFDDDGVLKNEINSKALDELMERLSKLAIAA